MQYEQYRNEVERRHAQQAKIVGQLNRWTRQRLNNAKLMEYLRRAQAMRGTDVFLLTPELAELLADILEGKLQAKATRKNALPHVLPIWMEPDDAAHLKRRVAQAVKHLEDDNSEATRAAIGRTPRLPLDTKGERRLAAEQLVADIYGMSTTELKWRMSPRKGRGKRS